jgi:transcriptional regulator with XRE-family HTH domain
MTNATDLLSELAATRALTQALADYGPEKRRELREENGISRKRVAEYIGCVANTFTTYENGSSVPRSFAVLERYVLLLRILEGELEAIPENRTDAN